MFKLAKILILAAAVMAFTTSAALADTFYDSMGYTFHYDEWDKPEGETLVKQDNDGSVYGFNGFERAGAFMSNMERTDTPRFMSINFSNFAAVGSEGVFGLEISWEAQDGDWDNLGVYRADSNGFSGFAAAYWDESEGDGVHGPDLAPAYGSGIGAVDSSATAGSLALDYQGSTLKFLCKESGATKWTTLFVANLSDLGENIAIGFSGEGATVEFSDYSTKATPIPGAVWLLGSGLLGLAGIRRKMRA